MKLLSNCKLNTTYALSAWVSPYSDLWHHRCGYCRFCHARFWWKKQKMLSAASIAASGTLKVIEKGSDLKQFNSAQSALNGLMAALTSWAGFSGPEDPLTGKTGFLKMCADDYDSHWLVQDRKDDLWIHKARQAIRSSAATRIHQ